MNTVTVTVTLNDGTEVRSDDRRWRDECLVRHQHVLNMRRLPRMGRHDYVLAVARREGDVAGERLKAAYGDDFERRKAECNAALAADTAKFSNRA